MKVAILYIGIGKYIEFWRGFYISCEKHFLVGEQKEYYVFTDEEKVFAEDKIHRVFQEDLGWPGNSLMRYSFFVKIFDQLEEFDYIFFFNGNILFLEDISKEEFCPLDDSLVVVQHHYFVNKLNIDYPYEREQNSSAYIPMGEGQYYVCGGLNGAKAPVFIEFIQTLYKRIEQDCKKGVVAIWHDESHVNRYILDYPNIKLLPPSYCYPELVANPEISSERKIICRDKRKYFNLYKFKEPELELKNLVDDSKRLLEEEHYAKIVQRWLYLQSKGINLGEYFRIKEINKIAIVATGRLAELFYYELKQKDVAIIKIINESYEDLYFNSIKYNIQGKNFATIVTDTYNFPYIYEIMELRGELNLISLEDIINVLYEKYKDPVINIYSSFTKSCNIEVKGNFAPISDLPENCKIVLYGGGKIGKKFYSIIHSTQFVKLVLWIDERYKEKQEEGLPVHNIDVLKDTLYDYIILGTKVEKNMKSMRNTLNSKGIDLRKAIWFDEKQQLWVCVEDYKNIDW